LGDPDFALERLARSDMKTLVTIADDLAASGELSEGSGVLHSMHDAWTLRRHYLSARMAAVESSAGLTPDDVDAATRSVIR
jgi:hypothetical protein